MPHIDMSTDHHESDAMLEYYQTHAKAGQRNTKIKDHLVDDTE